MLPIAIDRSVWIAARADPRARLRARSAAHPPPFEHALAALPDRASGWHRYLLGALRSLPEARPDRGASLWIDGDLPANGGLSSSSALTLGVLAALDAVLGLGLSREELVARAIRAERLVGVETGGMDQTVIAFAERGTALRIDFEPPARRAVALPAQLSLVAAYSGVAGPKADAARERYNARVVGCRIAAASLAAELAVGAGDPPVLGRVRRATSDVSGLLERASALPARQTAREAAAALGCDLERFTALSAARFDADHAVPVRACARHVLAESERVDAAERALGARDLAAFGRLLDESQTSLAEFGASSAELDALVAALRSAGAFGARLTGAGFGGYAFAALPSDRVDEALAAAHRVSGGPAFRVRASAGLELRR